MSICVLVPRERICHTRGRRSLDGDGFSEAPCHALAGRVGGDRGENQGYDLAASNAGGRQPLRDASGGVEQGDEADEGRLVAWRSMVGGHSAVAL